MAEDCEITIEGRVHGFTDAMLQAGFISTQSRMLDDIDIEAHGPVELTIGRKTP